MAGVSQQCLGIRAEDRVITHSLIGQPTFQLRTEQRHALSVGHLARRVPEIELANVAVQVLTGDVVMRPIERPLQLAKNFSHFCVPNDFSVTY